eukprot:764414-Hanusia_phi.AAC.3
MARINPEVTEGAGLGPVEEERQHGSKVKQDTRSGRITKNGQQNSLQTTCPTKVSEPTQDN